MALPLREHERVLLKKALDYVNSRRGRPVERGDLADWFERIAGSEKQKRERHEVAREVNEVLREKDIIKLVPQLRLQRGHRLEYVPDRDLYEGRSWAALATALILDERFGLTNRLKRCGNPDCLRFNLFLKPHGRPRRNCNKTCQRKAEAAASKERSAERREQQKRGK